jgi:hypothetical protein
VHEIKLDGWRLQVRVEDGTATLRTRKGLDYTHVFPELAKAARGFDNGIIDGEICFVRKDGITDFSGLQAAMKAGKTASLGVSGVRSVPIAELPPHRHPLVMTYGTAAVEVTRQAMRRLPPKLRIVRRPESYH